MLDIPKVVSIDNGPEGKRTMRLKVKSQGEPCKFRSIGVAVDMTSC